MTDNNTAVGVDSLAAITTGTDNTGLGAKTLAATTTGTDNVAVGSQSGSANVSGGSNVLLGYDTAPTLTSGSSNIIIGASEDVPTASTSNYLNIGGVITGDMSTGAITLANGFKGTTQSAHDNSTKLATTAYVDTAVAGAGGITLGTPQATTSGTSINFSGIPSTAKRVVVNFVGVTTSGSSNILVQIGPSGGVVSTGYLGSFMAVGTGTVTATSTAGFISFSGPSTNVRHGSITLSLENSSNNTWVSNGVICLSNAAVGIVTAGSISLSGALNKLSITTVNGTDTFTAGEINISYE